MGISTSSFHKILILTEIDIGYILINSEPMNDTKETYLEDIKGRKLIIIFIECLFLKHALIKFFKPIKSNKNKNLVSLQRILIAQSIFFLLL